MTVEEALEVLDYLLGHEKAVDSGEMEDVQNCLNSQEQEALKVILTEFRELKANEVAIAKATAKKPIPLDKDGEYHECPTCGGYAENNCGCAYRFCPTCGTEFDWSEGKE